MRKHPGRVASKGKLTGADDYTVIFCPCPIWPGAFLFLEFLEAVEVMLWHELVEGAAAD